MKSSSHAQNISRDDIEYDPLHRLGQNMSKVRSAGNSPKGSPSTKISELKYSIDRNMLNFSEYDQHNIESGGKQC